MEIGTRGAYVTATLQNHWLHWGQWVHPAKTHAAKGLRLFPSIKNDVSHTFEVGTLK